MKTTLDNLVWGVGLAAVSAVSLAACSGGQQTIPFTGAASTANTSTGSATQVGSATASTQSVYRAASNASAEDKRTYRSVVLQSKPSSFFVMNDSSNRMSNDIDPQVVGTYGSGVLHSGPALTSEGLASAQFPGGSYAPASVASTAPSSALQPSPTMALELLIQTNGNSSSDMEAIAAYGSEVTHVAYELDLTPRGTLKWNIAGGAPYRNWGYEGPIHVANGKPTHVAADFDGSSLHVYVNGVLDIDKKIVGPIDYGSLATGSAGLALGGKTADDEHTFSGSIADVAVYPRVLSVSEVTSHYQAMLAGPTPTPTPTSVPSATPAPSPTPIPNAITETPKSVFAFEDSVGIGADFQYGDSPYHRMPQAYANLLLGLHTHNIRGQGNGSTAETSLYDGLCANGVRHTIGFSLNISPRIIADQINTYAPGCVMAVEPMNEYDAWALNPAHPDRNWVSTSLHMQQILWQTVKSNPAWSHITVLGPSLSSLSRYALLGNLESISDAGNEHDGTCDGSPLTTHYKNIAQRIKLIQVSYPTKPIWVGETNYANNPQKSVCGVSKDVAAKYVPRMFLERFNLGQPHTFYNELSDNASEGPGWGSLGLTGEQANPYPAYYSLQSLLGALPQNQTGSATLQPLSYAIGGQTANVHHMLLQANDGSYNLVLWLEVDSWDVKAKVALHPAPQALTISLPSQYRQGAYSVPNGSSGLSSTTVNLNGSATLNVSDSPSVLSFK